MRISGSTPPFGDRILADPFLPLLRHWLNLLAMGALILILVCSASGAQVTSPTILELDVENIVSYSSDVFDASKLATDANLTTAMAARNFGFVMAVGDIVAVNGTIVKGSMVARQQAIRL